MTLLVISKKLRCVTCGEFRRTSSKKYCDICKENIEIRRKSRPWGNKKSQTCRRCGEPRDKFAQYCDTCRKRTRRESRQFHEARRKTAFVEIVDIDLLWEIDEGKCGICGDDVDPDNFHVDHIKPLSRGGKHEITNTQIAHPSCNIKKNNRLEGEYNVGITSV